VALNERYNHAYKTYASQRRVFFVIVIYTLCGARVSNIFSTTLLSWNS